MRTQFLKIIAFICVFVGMISCSDLKFGDRFLEKAPGTDVTLDTIFTSRLYADRALTAAYATLRCGLIVHMNNGEYYEFQSPGNKLGWDSLDAITDIIHSHCTWGGVYGMYYPGNYSAETENGNGSTKFGYNPTEEAAWTGIRRAYLYINNVDRVPDMSDEEKRIRKGECYMIIAAQYHEMLRHIGGVPILRDAVDAANQSEVDFSRKTFQETLDFILETCDKAAEMLPWTVSATDDGRFNRAAALALKVRVLLLAASPMFNATSPYLEPAGISRANEGKVAEADVPLMTWLGDYRQERWQAVVDACEEFLRENERSAEPYRLVEATSPDFENYRLAFSKCYADRHNGEIIMGTGRTMRTYGDMYHRMYYGPSYDNYNGVINDGRGYGGGCITLNFVDMFPSAAGERAYYRDWIAAHGHRGTLSDNPFVGRDPRLYETVMIVGDHFRDRVAEMWIDGQERSTETNPRAITGFCLRKFLWDYTASTFHDKPANYAYIRLPEIYLAYAEALNETGRSAEAYEWLNKTRRRVGLPDMTPALVSRLHAGEALPSYAECSLQGDPVLREEILDERAREFCFEEVRWFDVIRWKREDIFKKTLYGITMRVVSGSVEGGDLVLDFSDPEEQPVRYWKNNFSPKWYLSALPSNEVNKGYGLIQNPGW